MGTPTEAVRLALVIRAEHEIERQQQLCRLAGRLGYHSVWLTTGTAPRLTDLRGLVAAAAPARVGLIVDDLGPLVAWLRAIRNDPDLDSLLIDADPGPDRPRVVAALGGAEAFAERMHSRTFDPAAAGQVILARERDEATRRLRAARDELAAAGLRPSSFSLTVDVTVSIGRTMGEAQARVLRDPALVGERDPRNAGLFGTFAHAQQQVIDYVRAGATTMRVTLADESDVSDLLAQVRALTVGPVLALLSDEPVDGPADAPSGARSTNLDTATIPSHSEEN